MPNPNRERVRIWQNPSMGKGEDDRERGEGAAGQERPDFLRELKQEYSVDGGPRVDTFKNYL